MTATALATVIASAGLLAQSGSANAQTGFICGGTEDGATTAHISGAIANFGTNIACGIDANAEGMNGANIATGFEANASGAGSGNVASGALANASGAASGNVASGNNANASGDFSRNVATGRWPTPAVASAAATAIT